MEISCHENLSNFEPFFLISDFKLCSLSHELESSGIYLILIKKNIFVNIR